MIALFLIAVMVLLWWVQEPSVYRFYDPAWGDRQPRIVIIGSQHGNEQSPGIYLRKLVSSGWKPPAGLDVIIVPVANPAAFFFNRRYLWKDMNRSWPHSSLMPYMKDASLVIDLHEGWGHHACQSESLGQTLWANPAASSYKPLLDSIAAELNFMIDATECQKWRRVNRLPPVTGGLTLNQWCTQANKAYILVEIAGQDNIEPMFVRMKENEIIISRLLDIYQLKRYNT